jgi:hypothetical protein
MAVQTTPRPNCLALDRSVEERRFSAAKAADNLWASAPVVAFVQRP